MSSATKKLFDFYRREDMESFYARGGHSKEQNHKADAIREAIVAMGHEERFPYVQGIERLGETYTRSGISGAVKDKKAVLDVMIQHLSRPYSPESHRAIAADICRLEVPGILREALILFEEEPLAFPDWPNVLFAATGIPANVILKQVKPSDLDLLIPVFYDQTNGGARAILLMNLFTWKGPNVEQVLMSLTCDIQCQEVIQRFYDSRSIREAKKAVEQGALAPKPYSVPELSYDLYPEGFKPDQPPPMTQGAKKVYEYVIAEWPSVATELNSKAKDFFNREFSQETYFEKLSGLLDEEQAPILAQFKKVGESVARLTANQLLVKDKAVALYILIDQIYKPHSPYTRLAIAFSLMSLKVKGSFSTLFDLYLNEPIDARGWPITRADVKSALAYAACSVSTPADLTRLIQALYEPVHGRSRTVILATIEPWHDPRVDKALADMAADPDCAQLVERTYLYRANRARTGARIAIAKQIGALG